MMRLAQNRPLYEIPTPESKIKLDLSHRELETEKKKRKKKRGGKSVTNRIVPQWVVNWKHLSELDILAAASFPPSFWSLSSSDKNAQTLVLIKAKMDFHQKQQALFLRTESKVLDEETSPRTLVASPIPTTTFAELEKNRSSHFPSFHKSSSEPVSAFITTCQNQLELEAGISLTKDHLPMNDGSVDELVSSLKVHSPWLDICPSDADRINMKNHTSNGNVDDVKGVNLMGFIGGTLPSHNQAVQGSAAASGASLVPQRRLQLRAEALLSPQVPSLSAPVGALYAPRVALLLRSVATGSSVTSDNHPPDFSPLFRYIFAVRKRQFGSNLEEREDSQRSKSQREQSRYRDVGEKPSASLSSPLPHSLLGRYSDSELISLYLRSIHAQRSVIGPRSGFTLKGSYAHASTPLPSISATFVTSSKPSLPHDISRKRGESEKSNVDEHENDDKDKRDNKSKALQRHGAALLSSALTGTTSAYLQALEYASLSSSTIPATALLDDTLFIKWTALQTHALASKKLRAHNTTRVGLVRDNDEKQTVGRSELDNEKELRIMTGAKLALSGSEYNHAKSGEVNNGSLPPLYRLPRGKDLAVEILRLLPHQDKDEEHEHEHEHERSDKGILSEKDLARVLSLSPASSSMMETRVTNTCSSQLTILRSAFQVALAADKRLAMSGKDQSTSPSTTRGGKNREKESYSRGHSDPSLAPLPPRAQEALEGKFSQNTLDLFDFARSFSSIQLHPSSSLDQPCTPMEDVRIMAALPSPRFFLPEPFAPVLPSAAAVLPEDILRSMGGDMGFDTSAAANPTVNMTNTANMTNTLNVTTVLGARTGLATIHDPVGISIQEHALVRARLMALRARISPFADPTSLSSTSEEELESGHLPLATSALFIPLHALESGEDTYLVESFVETGYGVNNAQTPSSSSKSHLTSVFDQQNPTLRAEVGQEGSSAGLKMLRELYRSHVALHRVLPVIRTQALLRLDVSIAVKKSKWKLRPTISLGSQKMSLSALFDSQTGLFAKHLLTRTPAKLASFRARMTQFHSACVAALGIYLGGVGSDKGPRVMRDSEREKEREKERERGYDNGFISSVPSSAQILSLAQAKNGNGLLELFIREAFIAAEYNIPSVRRESAIPLPNLASTTSSGTPNIYSQMQIQAQTQDQSTDQTQVSGGAASIPLDGKSRIRESILLLFRTLVYLMYLTAKNQRSISSS